MTQKGFTLIEISVVAVIVLVFSSIILTSLPQARSQFNLSQVAHAFAQNVRRAQQMALASQVYKDSTGAVKFVDRYGVHINTAQNKSYDIFADSSFTPAIDYTVETVDFSSSNRGVVIKSIDGVPNSERWVYFTFPNGKAYLQDFVVFPSKIDILFALEADTNVTKLVTINSAGLVEVK